MDEPITLNPNRAEGHTERVIAAVVFLIGILGTGALFLFGVFRVGLSNSNFWGAQNTVRNYASSLPEMWFFAAVSLTATIGITLIVVNESVKRRPYFAGVLMFIWAVVATGFNWWIMSAGPGPSDQPSGF